MQSGPLLDVGAGPMLTAWFLGEQRAVLAATLGAELAPELAEVGNVIALSEEPLVQVFESLHQLGSPPGLLFLQPSLLFGGQSAGSTSAKASAAELWPALSRFRQLFPRTPVAGAMLTSEGREVPHWAVPSLLAPVLGIENNLTMELPCWASGGCGRPLERPLLTLVMIIRDEARRIRETLESVAPAADRAVILDTGSQDGTQRIVRETCKRIRLPLELYEEQFVDFSTTRNRVLQLASNATEFVLMLSGDETLAQPAELRTFVQQHAGYCGVSEDIFNIRVFMGPSTWYWSERLLRADNHMVEGWPFSNHSWRYVGVTHEAYVNPVLTMSGDLFIQYVGDTDKSQARGMPAAVAGQFYISHDAERPAEKHRRRLWQDVHLLEGYLDRPDAHEDEWQYARSVFYLAQSHRSLGFGDVARDLWERFLGLGFSQKRQFSYLGYGAHNALGQLCAEESARRGESMLPDACRRHFEEAHALCPRVEPLVYMAMAMPARSRERLEVLRRAAKAAPMQAASGHCAIFAEPTAYERLPQLLREAEAAVIGG